MAIAMAARRSGSTVYFAPARCKPDHGIIDDGQRIFTARIVGSQHHEIAAPARGFAHQRTLGAIAVAAASENRNYSALASGLLHKFARQRGQVAQRIVGVGIVHNHGERLTAIHALKSPRHAAQVHNSFANRLRRATARKAAPQPRQ